MDEGWTRTTCPYCGVGCGVLARATRRRERRDQGRPGASGQFRPALLQGLGARRDAVARRPAARRRSSTAPRATWDEALDRVAAALLRDDRRARPRQRRLLRLRPVADRGLLRRQQADEGLHRLGQYRHQFAPLHGVVGRRPPPRLRLGHGAGRYEDLEQADLVVLVGSNLAWCHPVLFQRLIAAREKRGTEDRRRSTRARPRPPRPPTCISRSRPAPTSRCSTACSRISPRPGRVDRRFVERAYGRASRRRSPRRRAFDLDRSRRERRNLRPTR